MSNILTVFGIFLAVFTYIESLYHSKIEWAINEIYVDKKVIRNNKANYHAVKLILLKKQLPLLLLALAINCLMFPISINIIMSSYKFIMRGVAVYDIVHSTILFINLCFVVILITQGVKFTQIIIKFKELKYK